MDPRRIPATAKAKRQGQPFPGRTARIDPPRRTQFHRRKS